MNWEVRTMRSAISSLIGRAAPRGFTPAVWKNFARFWPIWSLYGPSGGVTAHGQYSQQPDTLRSDRGMARSRLCGNYLGLRSIAVLRLPLCSAYCAAMAVFSYLYFSRSADMIHALPLRREGLFLTNYLSGLSFLLLPNPGGSPF